MTNSLVYFLLVLVVGCGETLTMIRRPPETFCIGTSWRVNSSRILIRVPPPSPTACARSPYRDPEPHADISAQHLAWNGRAGPSAPPTWRPSEPPIPLRYDGGHGS